MRIIALSNIAPTLRDALLQHLQDFDARYPGSQLERLEQTTATVSMAEALRNPGMSVAALAGGPDVGPAAPSGSPFERATAAILAHPDIPDRTLAKKIGVSHQTVGRTREMLKNKPGGRRSKRPVGGPGGPKRRRAGGSAPGGRL
jgi:hypothetical protein